MTFFPADFDPRDAVVGMLDLCEIDTADGTFRFMIGTDGIFTDVNGNQWIGSVLASVSSLESAIDGVAPQGSLSLTFFQDPTMPDMVQQVKDLGLDYVAGREVRFYVQPIRDMAELYAPTTAPVRWLTRIARQLSFSANGAQNRGLSLGFEAWSERRGAARRIALNTEGHAALTGAANPSLEFIPTTNFQPEKLFG